MTELLVQSGHVEFKATLVKSLTRRDFSILVAFDEVMVKVVKESEVKLYPCGSFTKMEAQKPKLLRVVVHSASAGSKFVKKVSAIIRFIVILNAGLVGLGISKCRPPECFHSSRSQPERAWCCGQGLVRPVLQQQQYRLQQSPWYRQRCYQSAHALGLGCSLRQLTARNSARGAKVNPCRVMLPRP